MNSKSSNTNVYVYIIKKLYSELPKNWTF